MKTKQFKIGESAIGGIIKVTVSDDKIEVDALDWNTKQVVKTGTFFYEKVGSIAWYSVQYYLEELTTSYYADKIMNWVKS